MTMQKNMYLVEHIDPTPFLNELASFIATNPWDTERSQLTVQRETMGVPLRNPRKIFVRSGDPACCHMQFSVPTISSRAFPATMAFLFSFARKQRSVLSRVLIARLPKDKQVYPHVDFGEYYDLRNRYHFVLKSGASKMISGDETAVFQAGDLFYFNNHLLHEAHNQNDEDRIHLIFDLLPISFRSFWGVGVSLCKTGIWNSQQWLHRKLSET